MVVTTDCQFINLPIVDVLPRLIQPIVELETDKVTLEVPASITGILENTLVSEGDTVEVGALLGTIIAGEKQDKKEKVPEEVEVKDVEKEKPITNKIEVKSILKEFKVNG